MGLRGPDDVLGKVEVTANDGTGASLKTKGPDHVAVSEEVEKGPATAKGEVIQWDYVFGIVHAKKAPPPNRALASCKSTNTATSNFEIVQEDFQTFLLYTETTITAKLTEGTATIRLEATVTTSSGAAVGPPNLNKTYTLTIDPADTTKLIIGGGQPNSMENDGSTPDKQQESPFDEQFIDVA